MLVPGEKMWKVYLDVIVLDSSASNLVEHLTLASLLSLQSISLPNLSAIKNKNTGEIEYGQTFVQPLDVAINSYEELGRAIEDVLSPNPDRRNVVNIPVREEK